MNDRLLKFEAIIFPKAACKVKTQFPKLAQKIPCVHFRDVKHLTQLPIHCKHFWGAPDLPRLETKYGKENSNKEGFMH
jgi:hypothetical protein